MTGTLGPESAVGLKKGALEERLRHKDYTLSGLGWGGKLSQLHNLSRPGKHLKWICFHQDSKVKLI